MGDILAAADAQLRDDAGGERAAVPLREVRIR
jgi:hypothetical protein